MALSEQERLNASRYAERRFGKSKAQPKILEYYLPEGGFRPIWDKDLRLTADTADQLRQRGISMVRVKAGMFKIFEVSIRRYLGAA